MAYRPSRVIETRHGRYDVAWIPLPECPIPGLPGLPHPGRRRRSPPGAGDPSHALRASRPTRRRGCPRWRRRQHGGRTDPYQEITGRIITALERGTVPWRTPWRARGHRNARSSRPYRGITHARPPDGRARARLERPALAHLPPGRGRGRARPPRRARHPRRALEVARAEGPGGSRAGGALPADPPLRRLQRRPVRGRDAARTGGRRLRGSAGTRGGGDRGLPGPTDAPLGRRGRLLQSPSTTRCTCRRAQPSATRTATTRRSSTSSPTPPVTRDASRARDTGRLPASAPSATRRRSSWRSSRPRFLGSEAGIDPSRVEQSAAYIASWLRVLDDDRRLVVVAAAQGQRAADHILGRSPEREADAGAG